ncbi:MAG: hypothetical protein M3N98_12815 [Actinomycetota bacterium]|nr:hypothetical protein [Actinomycetota bacterium]
MGEDESQDHPFGVRATNATKNDDGSVTAETLAPTEATETTEEAAP